MNTYKLSNACGIVLGLFLLTQGIWSLVNPAVFGGSINWISAFVCIASGCAGIYYGNRGNARNYNIITGILLLLVALLWFISGTNEIIRTLLNMNSFVAPMDIIAGIPALILGIITPVKKHRYNIVLLY